MTRMDAHDLKSRIEIENPVAIELYPIQHFQFPNSERQTVYEILNISANARIGFDDMFDQIQAIPIANIYNNPINQEGFMDDAFANNSIDAWRNIYRIRKSFFEKRFLRVVLTGAR
jgi:hypothetical protein